MTAYTDRRGPGKTAESEPTAAITPDPIVNAPPRFRTTGLPAVMEGAAGEVGRLRPTDRDNDTLTFGIREGDDSEYFAINSATGQIRTTQALDFESTSGFLEFTITLHDGRDADGDPSTEVDVTKDFVIFVIDVEEPGVVTLPADKPEVGTPLQATLADGDGNVSGSRWRMGAVGERPDRLGPTSWARPRAPTRPRKRMGTSTCGPASPTPTGAGAARARRRLRRAPVPSENRRPTLPVDGGRPTHRGGEHEGGREHRRRRWPP